MPAKAPDNTGINKRIVLVHVAQGEITSLADLSEKAQISSTPMPNV
jgi:hypothetical protein